MKKWLASLFNYKSWGDVSELEKIRKDYLSFFFLERRYRIVRTDDDGTQGWGAISWSSGLLLWRLSEEKSAISLECRPVAGKKGCWYSVILLSGLLSDKRMDRKASIKEKASWVEENLSEIEDRFSPERCKQTIDELGELRKLIAKEYWEDIRSE